jgi:hypothetical protein
MFVLRKLLTGRAVRGICVMDLEIHTEILLGKSKGRKTREKYKCRWNMVEQKLRNKSTRTYVSCWLRLGHKWGLLEVR